MAFTSTVVICPNQPNAIASVQATAEPDWWGDPVLSANGWAKWAAWDVSISSAMRAGLQALAPTVQLFQGEQPAVDQTANATVGWVDP